MKSRTFTGNSSICNSILFYEKATIQTQYFSGER